MVKGLVTDIQRASFHDGDGIRTTVFFKGCPLSCAWCHNPECISFEKEILEYPEKCIGCGLCTTKCAFDAVHLHRENPECSNMVKAEDKLKHIFPYMFKRQFKIWFKKGKKK